MPSNWTAARDAISTLWLAVTPADGAAYSRAQLDEQLDGDLAHRTFMHALPSAPSIIEQSNTTVALEYKWTAALYLSTSEYTFDSAGQAVADEALAFWRAVNTNTSWPAGVDLVRSEGGYETTVDAEAGHIIITFDLRAVIQEDTAV